MVSYLGKWMNSDTEGGKEEEKLVYHVKKGSIQQLNELLKTRGPNGNLLVHIISRAAK